VYVRNLNGGEGLWQISTDGGGNPRWRSDGREMFYESADGYLMMVPWQAGAASGPRGGRPGGSAAGTGSGSGGGPGTLVRLFQFSERSEPGQFGLEVFGDVTPDGQRFLLNVPTTSPTSIGFH